MTVKIDNIKNEKVKKQRKITKGVEENETGKDVSPFKNMADCFIYIKQYSDKHGIVFNGVLCIFFAEYFRAGCCFSWGHCNSDAGI